MAKPGFANSDLQMVSDFLHIINILSKAAYTLEITTMPGIFDQKLKELWANKYFENLPGLIRKELASLQDAQVEIDKLVTENLALSKEVFDLRQGLSLLADEEKKQVVDKIKQLHEKNKSNVETIKKLPGDRIKDLNACLSALESYPPQNFFESVNDNLFFSFCYAKNDTPKEQRSDDEKCVDAIRISIALATQPAAPAGIRIDDEVIRTYQALDTLMGMLNSINSQIYAIFESKNINGRINSLEMATLLQILGLEFYNELAKISQLTSDPIIISLQKIFTHALEVFESDVRNLTVKEKFKEDVRDMQADTESPLPKRFTPDYVGASKEERVGPKLINDKTTAIRQDDTSLKIRANVLIIEAINKLIILVKNQIKRLKVERDNSTDKRLDIIDDKIDSLDNKLNELIELLKHDKPKDSQANVYSIYDSMRKSTEINTHAANTFVKRAIGMFTHTKTRKEIDKGFKEISVALQNNSNKLRS